MVQQDWAPPWKSHTKYSYSYSGRASGALAATLLSNYDDGSRQREDHKACGPAKENEGVPEAVVVAEVEAVDNSDKHLGRATDDCVAPYCVCAIRLFGGDSSYGERGYKDKVGRTPSSE